MSFALIDTVVDSLTTVFGGRLFLPIILVLMLAVILLSLKGGKILFVLITFPLVLTMVLVAPTSRLFQGLGIGTEWIGMTIWLVLGLIMASIFWQIIS